MLFKVLDFGQNSELDGLQFSISELLSIINLCILLKLINFMANLHLNAIGIFCKNITLTTEKYENGYVSVEQVR